MWGAGVEAHTIVRDQLTSQDEQSALKAGRLKQGSLRPDAAPVDAIVSTIGFPLVGGPAGMLASTHCSRWCLTQAAVVRHVHLNTYGLSTQARWRAVARQT
jgi:hypothetical protein